jgi:hypothetical protein
LNFFSGKRIREREAEKNRAMSGGLFTGVFADKRLDRRCEQIFWQMVSKKSAVLHQSMASKAALTGAYRFMNHQQVNYELIGHRLTSSWPVKGKNILCLQDTSEANFTWHSGALKVNDAHLGPVGNPEEVGFFMHPSLCLDMGDGFPLGFSDVFLFNRPWQQADKYQRKYKSQPLPEKESYRWIERAEESKRHLTQAAYVLFVSDRESDLFPLFERLPDAKSDVLIRLSQDRLLYGQEGKISDQLEQTLAMPWTLALAKSGQRKKRLAQLQIKFTSLPVARPKHATRQGASYVVMSVIEAREEAGSVPKGEEPVFWRLITSKQVDNLQAAVQCLHYYALRWKMEELFGLVKSEAMHLEQSQLSQGKALKIMAMLSLQAALQILQLKEGRAKTDQSATLAFCEKELLFMRLLCTTLAGKTVKQQNPYPENSMAYAAWIIGRLGGWKGLYSQGPPGIKSFSSGLKIFQQQYEGFLLAQKFSSA